MMARVDAMDSLERYREENDRLRAENERLRALLGLAGGEAGGKAGAERAAGTARTSEAAQTSQAERAAGAEGAAGMEGKAGADRASPRLFPEDEPLPEVDGRSAPEAEVRLFRRLFRGREDVYARYWSDARSGKRGYAPATRGRTGSAAKEYLALTDEVVYRHLRGEEIVGLYPLLRDDACFLLACDFDGVTWAPDALGLVEAAERWGVPAYLERSRSGLGGHVWIFFTRAVAAVQARRLGTGLLRETMVARGEMDLASYDRLFPNQDFMPKGGFGNLIALPLQKVARALGNTELVDRELRPWPDPWRGLSEVRRVTPEVLQAVVDALPPVQVGLDGVTRLRRSGGAARERPAPEVIRCTRGSRLSIERSGLPPSLLSAIKHLACLHNPEHFKRERLRLSVYGTPRLLRCYEEDLTHLHLPRGVLGALVSLVEEAGSRMHLEDVRVAPARAALALAQPLGEKQEEAVREMLRHDEGVLVAPPGSGKTRMACAVIAARNTPALVLVHRRPLLDQWREELMRCLGLESRQIGQLGGGRRRRRGVVDLAMIQSLGGDDAAAVLAEYGQIVVDECHHLPAVSFDGLIRRAPARYVLGLTATPYRRDGLGNLIMMRCGPIRHRLAGGPGDERLERRLVVVATGFDPGLPEGAPIQEIYRALAADEERNRLVGEDARKALAMGASCLILTERRDHLDRLGASLEAMGFKAVLLHGGVPRKERLARVAALNEAAAEEPLLVLATGALLGEGFDLPRLDTLLLAFPLSFRGKIVQYAGRILREHPGKAAATVIDYHDGRVPVLARMGARRRKALRAIGFECGGDVEGRFDRGDAVRP